MALVSVMSAKGAPGATTTAMLLASLWPRPTLLVDADPHGGDVALRIPRADGRPIDRERGLLSLLPAARRGLLPTMVAEHAQTALGGQQVVAGLAGPEQAAAVTPLWPALADSFARVPGTDVIVDAGQVHQRAAHLALVERSDMVLWVYRPTAWSAVHTRRRLEGLAGLLADAPIRTGVVAVAAPDQETDAVSAAQAIIGDWEWPRAYGAVALDPRAVVMFEGGEVHRPEKTLLARSGRTLADRLYSELPGNSATLSAPDHDPEALEAPEVTDDVEEQETSTEDRTERKLLRNRRRGGQRRANRGERTS